MSVDAACEALASKAQRLVDTLTGYGSVAIAFSGGVDSAVVAKAAQLALSDQAVAVTAASPSLASGEREQAEELARLVGIRHHVVTTAEFDNPEYAQNAPNRCYFCKTELYTRLESLLPELGVETIANGANTDDCGDWRPGMQAAGEHRVRSPLIESGMNKADVRALAQHWGLPVWDKPAMPCLSSRIAYGVAVTPERVAMIDAAESFLREQGFAELRVRCHAGDVARIEVPASELPRLADPAWRVPLVSYLKQLGFKFVSLDLEGFRSGSLNQGLPGGRMPRP